MLGRFGYVRANSLSAALDRLGGKAADGGAVRILAGGTDLLGCLRDGVFDAGTLVALGRITELRGVRETADGGLSIGALTTIAEIERHPLIKERYAALAKGAAEVASPQLRNQGTLGGNLCQKPRCWYYRGDFHCLRKGGPLCFAVAGENQFHCILGGNRCFIVHPSDTAPALLAFGASARMAGPRGTRTVPLEKFFVLPEESVLKETVAGPDEIVTEIILPPFRGLKGQTVKSSYRKVRARRSWDFALAGVAFAVSFSGNKVAGARIVLSGAAPVPWRSREAEAAITGKALDAATAAAAAEAAMKPARPLRQNGYKIDLFRGLIEEELLALGRQMSK